MEHARSGVAESGQVRTGQGQERMKMGQLRSEPIRRKKEKNLNETG